MAIPVFNLVPAEFPDHLLPLGVALVVLRRDHRAGMDRAHWMLRIFPVLALVFCVVAAFTVINQTYDYYPTLARLLGKDAANFTDLPALQRIRDEVRRTGKLPDPRRDHRRHHPADHLQVPGPAGLRLPPAHLVHNPEPQLPVIELIAGVPGQPSDWTRAGYADTTATAFADQHHGVAPHPGDPRQQRGQDPGQRVLQQCLRERRDLPGQGRPQLHAGQFNAAIGKHSLAVAGLSAGGTCATMLALRNPKTFSTFASYSGYASPTYQNDDEQQTIAQLYGGSRGQLRGPQPGRPAHRAAVRRDRPAGSPPANSDPQPLAAAAARRSGREDRDAGLPRPHRPATTPSSFWAAAFRTSLPWLSWRLGLTPPPKDWRPLRPARPLRPTGPGSLVDARLLGSYAAPAPLAQR